MTKSKKLVDKNGGDDKVQRSEQQQQRRSARKTSEYGRQLEEKQKVKEAYGMREQQFRRFFKNAEKQKGATGETLLSMLERRLDNVLYRLKLSVTRRQARQIIVHGHVRINGKHVYSPSYLVNINDAISLAPTALQKTVFLEQVVDKRLNIGIKVPEWLELDKSHRVGRVLRMPVRADVQMPIEEHLIVELYSK
jgi:small subunit ribosomal protein S4